MLISGPLTHESRNALERQLERIEASKSFSRCGRLMELLRFVCAAAAEGRAGELKETVIAVSVFSRAASYDPKKDSIVRTEASRLRKRLKKYYEDEGRTDSVCIDLPPGSYLPVLEFRIHSGAPVQRKTRWNAITPALALAAILLTWAWVRWQRPEIVLAILPFEDLSGNNSPAYLGQSVSREVHHNLSTVESLRLVGRATVTQFRPGPAALREASRQIKADYFITGAVRRVGGRVTLRAEMTKSENLVEVWSFGAEETEAAGLEQLEERVARQAANALRRELGNLRRRYDIDPDLKDRFRQADYYLSSFRAPEAALAIPILDEIIRRDPSFAPAHAALAHALLNNSYNGVSPVQESEARMDQLAHRALELDPLLADAHSALGFLEMRRYRWREAEDRFQQALRLDPDSPQAYYGLGFAVYAKSGRYEEAVQTLQRGLRRDPLSQRLLTSLSIAHHFAGQCGSAVATASRLVREGNPMVSGSALATIARCACAENLDKGVEEARRLNSPDWEAYCFAKYGRQAEARALFEKHSANRYMRMAYFAGTRDSDRLLTLLEQDFRNNNPALPFYLHWPEFHFLRPQPRYRELRRLVHLPVTDSNR